MYIYYTLHGTLDRSILKQCASAATKQGGSLIGATTCIFIDVVCQGNLKVALLLDIKGCGECARWVQAGFKTASLGSQLRGDGS